jgi:NAD(P)-dependent dehydrogenase (short-subunit alcohol dehydrogenase family)
MNAPSAAVLDRFRLDGRIAIVTGASSGLGEGIARALAQAGARVAVVARRYERLVKLADEIGGLPVACDLAEASEVATVVPAVCAGLGPPEILVSAAGHYVAHDRAENEKLDAVRRSLDLNLIAPFVLSQGVYPHMAAAGRGAIVYISSISGHVGIPGIPQASYAASKLGLSGLTRELAIQWARGGIRVNTIAPGFFRSEMTDAMWTDERTLAWLTRNTPLPPDGKVDDLTGAVLWLVGDAGRLVTGQTIVIDGGWTAR